MALPCIASSSQGPLVPTASSWCCAKVQAAVQGLERADQPNWEGGSGLRFLRSDLLHICGPLRILRKQVPVLCPLNDFVVHIRHVHDIQDAVAKVVLQYAAHNVKGDIVPRVPQVGSIIHCGSTGVPGQLPAGIEVRWGGRAVSGEWVGMQLVIAFHAHCAAQDSTWPAHLLSGPADGTSGCFVSVRLLKRHGRGTAALCASANPSGGDQCLPCSRAMS